MGILLGPLPSGAMSVWQNEPQASGPLTAAGKNRCSFTECLAQSRDTHSLPVPQGGKLGEKEGKEE